jgi:uncharacterized membrane protein YphA (DoxX/SURF4 family)
MTAEPPVDTRDQHASGSRGDWRAADGRPGRHWGAWAATALRAGLAAVALSAGLLKVGDPAGNVRTVRAYQILPDGLDVVVAHALPTVEILLGLVLLLGLFTRVSAVLFGLLMVVFLIGVVSAWARGLAIDCGCFGTGGPIDPAEVDYLPVVLRDLTFLAGAAVLAVFPRSRLSLDHSLGLVR